VLLWVYYSAQIFLFGAEFTWVYCHRFGSRRGQPIAADPSISPSHGYVHEPRGHVGP
jgi:membrane protein